jgi:hypothetical protein
MGGGKFAGTRASENDFTAQGRTDADGYAFGL